MAWRGTLLAASGDAKTVKGEKKGFLTAIMYLAPNTIATKKTLCPHATPACIAACLYTAGRGAMPNVQLARIRKAKAFEKDPQAFLRALVSDIDKFQAYATRNGLIPCVRLNGTSDIMWERLRLSNVMGDCGPGPRHATLMDLFPGLQFYDYTKIPPRLRRNVPRNYDLTFSQSEANEHATKQALADGFRVATVFFNRPKRWLGHKVIDGDANDLRFLDKTNVIVGLSAKGAAKRDKSGFVK